MRTYSTITYYYLLPQALTTPYPCVGSGILSRSEDSYRLQSADPTKSFGLEEKKYKCVRGGHTGPRRTEMDFGGGGRRREGKENPYFPALIKILECDKLLKSLA